MQTVLYSTKSEPQVQNRFDLIAVDWDVFEREMEHEKRKEHAEESKSVNEEEDYHEENAEMEDLSNS